MRLLLTRARDDAERTRTALEAAGHKAILSPMIETVFTEAQWPDGVFDAVMATSAKAFAFVPTTCVREARRLFPLYLVGSRTQEAARRAGFDGAALVAKTAEGLATRIAEGVPKASRLLYLAGRDRKDQLETALGEAGIDVVVHEVYAAVETSGLEPDAIAAFEAQKLDGVLHFSRRSAALFLASCTRAHLDQTGTRHFCLSEDVAVELRDANCSDLRVADEPTEVGLLALLD